MAAMVCGMAEVEATRSGIVSCYLSRIQLTALLRLAGEEGLSRQQIIKRAIVRELIDNGMLSEMEMAAVQSRQQALVVRPHSNLKPVGQLRMSREISEEEITAAQEREAKRLKEKESLDRLRENTRRIAQGLPTLEEEADKVEEVPARRVRKGVRRRRR
jgi:hypothetical protein